MLIALGLFFSQSDVRNSNYRGRIGEQTHNQNNKSLTNFETLDRLKRI